MAIKKFTLDDNEKLTEKQLQMMQEAAARQAVFDEDSPELTDEQLASFRRVHEHNQKERRRQNVTLRLKPQSVRKAKALGKGYSGILSRIVENILDDPAVLQKYL
ncbi:MAG: BrnA antitoxin family protein [Eubacterium sp.]|nr:BrnA antitoxin family protein [Eubacterium sp.]